MPIYVFEYMCIIKFWDCDIERKASIYLGFRILYKVRLCWLNGIQFLTMMV